jgi:uncharacterized glyoxalase superfamily protein PhnB
MKAHEVNPVLGTRDVRAAVAYYCDELGFVCEPDGIFEGADPDEGAVYAIVVMDDARVHLQIRRHDALFVEPRESIETDVYVFVDDAYGLYDRYVAKGVTIHRPIEVAPYGMADFVVETPDRHRLAFGSPTS